MTRWAGKIGYGIENEVSPGIFEYSIVEQNYIGKLLKLSSRNTGGGTINSDFTISNQVSFIADQFANNNADKMKYITIYGTKWKISSFDISYPRIVITVGGLYDNE